MTPGYTKDMIKGAEKALEYIEKGAKLIKSGSLGEWFELTEKLSYAEYARVIDDLPIYSDGNSLTDKEVQALRAFAQKNPGAISACAEGQIYLGAPSVDKARDVIAATNRLLDAAGVASGVIELNDSGFKDKLGNAVCPAPWMIRRKIERAIARAKKYLAGDKTTVQRENARVKRDNPYPADDYSWGF